MSVDAETNGADVTSWIPLTNVFTPSAGCDSYFRLNGPSLVAFDPGYGLDIDSKVKCAPAAVTTWWEQARLGVGGDQHTAISIQPLVCPYLWTTVATYIKDSSTTQVMCCPSGYSNIRATSGSVNGDCVSSVGRGMVLKFASTAAGESTDWSIATTTLAASSSVGAIAIVGFNAPSKTPSTTPSISAGSSAPSNPPTSQYIRSSSSFASSVPDTSPTIAIGQNSSAANEMSTGVKIGIGVGASLGTIGVITLALTLLLLRSRKQKTLGSTMPTNQAANTTAEYKHVDTVHVYPQGHHLTNYEIHGSSLPSEMPSGEATSPVELDSHGWSRRS